MALPQWPATLPVIPISEGTEIASLRLPPIQTPMEDGNIRQRRRSVSKLSRVTLQFLLTETQMTTFLTFVLDTLFDGVRRFEMPVWKPGAAEPFPLRTVTIVGAADAVKTRTIGLLHYVSIPLQVRDY